MTPLCQLAYMYRTDKCPKLKHPYTPYYYELLKDKKINKVLELGVKMGSSLYMWKTFFPEAKVYGIDIRKVEINKEGIETFICDGTKKDELIKVLAKIGTDIDLFIDDGSHRTRDQIATCKILRPILKNAIYIIEDVKYPDTLKKGLPYKVEYPVLENIKYNDDRLAVIKL
jgi:cephalosporin hydroxylase